MSDLTDGYLMDSRADEQKMVYLPSNHEIPGIDFRKFQGQTDFYALAEVLTASCRADQEERTVTAENLAEVFRYSLSNCDPTKDLMIVEVDGEMVAYARGWWDEGPFGIFLYKHNCFFKPEWRGIGIEQVLLAWVEKRLREISEIHVGEDPKFFQVSISQHQGWLEKILLDQGYQPKQYYYLMVRPTLQDLPEFPLVEGLETRPVEGNQYQAIWNLIQSTGEDSLQPEEKNEQAYQEWLTQPQFQPHLWQIAWDKKEDLPIGHVLTYIEQEENRQYNRKRGYTEGIGVIPKWRRQGVARALISLSLKAQKEAGMEESALVADSDSEFKVTELYESCGFQVVHRDTIFQKPLVTQGH